MGVSPQDPGLGVLSRKNTVGTPTALTVAPPPFDSFCSQPPEVLSSTATPPLPTHPLPRGAELGLGLSPAVSLNLSCELGLAM